VLAVLDKEIGNSDLNFIRGYVRGFLENLRRHLIETQTRKSRPAPR